jgi:hypothetical protein
MTDQTPANHKNAKEYELLAHAVYQQILKQEGLETIEVKHNEKVVGKSGVAHQIDVLWLFRHAGVEHVVAVECKNYSSSVELGDVRSFHSVIEDLGIARGVMVTCVGFQSGAREFAKHHRIDLKLLRAPLEEDWEDRIREVTVNISIKSFDRKRQPSITFGIPKEFGPAVSTARIKGEGIELQLLDAGGLPITPPMRQWLDQVVPILQQDAGGPYEHEIRPQNAHLRFERDCGEDILVPVETIKITYYVSEANQTIEIVADNIVKAILKDVESGEIEYFLRADAR